MHLVSCTNTHHNITDLVNQGMIEYLEHLDNGTELFHKIKKFLSCTSDGTFWEVIVL